MAELRRRGASRRWVAGVHTVSTFPPPGLFTRDAATIARVLASPEVSPRGPVSGLRMLLHFMNRGGRGIPPARRAELEEAKRLLMARLRAGEEKDAPGPGARAGRPRAKRRAERGRSGRGAHP